MGKRNRINIFSTINICFFNSFNTCFSGVLKERFFQNSYSLPFFAAILFMMGSETVFNTFNTHYYGNDYLKYLLLRGRGWKFPNHYNGVMS